MKIRKVVESLDNYPNDQIIKGYMVRINNYAKNNNCKVKYYSNKIVISSIYSDNNSETIYLSNGITSSTVNNAIDIVNNINTKSEPLFSDDIINNPTDNDENDLNNSDSTDEPIDETDIVEDLDDNYEEMTDDDREIS